MMKQIYFLILAFFCVIQLQAQIRYVDEIFTEVDVIEDVHYTSNWTVLYYPITGFYIPQDLKMDIYEPADDVEQSRPVVMICHSGQFLPFPENTRVSGDKRDMTVVEIATRLAKRGYVAVTVDYRLGWNPIAETLFERKKTFVQAVYRASQDTRAANRFLRHSVDTQGNPYGVDPDNIALFGIGSGGFISQFVGHVDDAEELLIPKFIETTPNGDIPIIDEAIYGNINGTSLGINPLTGDTICMVDEALVGYSSEFVFTTNLSGAILDTSFIDEHSLPQVAFHVPADPSIPCGDDYYTYPVPAFVDYPTMQLNGSCTVIPRLNENGVNDVLEDFVINDEWTNAANANNGGAIGLMLFLTSDTTFYHDPWDMYMDDNINAQVPPNNESAMLYIDTILGYWSTRSYQAFYLLGTNIEEVETTDIIITPNPSTEYVVINSPNKKMISVHLFDIEGRLIYQNTHINHNQFAIKRNEISPGMYVVQVQTNGDIVTKKILFN